MKDDMFSSNRRKFPRKSFRKPISYMSEGRGEVVEGVEIGEGGISFRSSLTLKNGQWVVVNFFLPGGDFFSIRTVLRNSIKENKKNWVYGLSFDDVSIGLKRQIRAYVARTSSSVGLLRA